MSFLLRTRAVRAPLCPLSRRAISTTSRLCEDLRKDEAVSKKKKINWNLDDKVREKRTTPQSRRLMVSNGSRVASVSQGHDPKSRLRIDHGERSSGRHGMFRSAVLGRYHDVVKEMGKSSMSTAGLGEEEFKRHASLFMEILEQAFVLAEQNITQRNRNPLFWNLRDAFVLKDLRGLSKELQYSFQSYLIRQRFSKGLEESHKRLLDFRFPYEWFPATRTMQRTIHLHVGPTNSGKTYRALKALENSKRGVYAGPLRLLANEVYQRLLAKGLPCALMTGEEIRIPEDTDTYFSSCTVEMMPVNEIFDVAVIDEIQMIADPDRGSAWTTALLGVQAKEVHLCGEERTVKLIQSMCASIGDECIVHRYERLSPLETMDESINGDYNKLQKGDAIVAFSRLNLHALKRTVETHTGRRCAIIYGSLPPEVRAQQAALFNDPDNDYDYIVASDAIGMGLNLEIRRVILNNVVKFDGNQNRILTSPEMKQIGGRAGRYRTARSAVEAGTDPESAPVDEGPKIGYVTTMDRQDLKSLRHAFASDVDDIEAAYVSPPVAAVERFSTYFPSGTPLSFILMRIRELASVSKNLRLSITSEKLEIADIIHDIPLTIYDRLTLCHLPMSLRAFNAKGILRSLAKVIALNQPGDLLSLNQIPLETLDIDIKKWNGKPPQDYLHMLESLHVAINQYVWLSYRFSGVFHDQELAFHVRHLVEEKLVETLETMDFTEDLETMRQKGRMNAHSTKWVRAAIGEGHFDNLEQETDDLPIGYEDLEPAEALAFAGRRLRLGTPREARQMQAEVTYHRSIADYAVPNAPYTDRGPSPPFIHIPPTGHATGGDSVPALMPSYDNVDSSQLTARDVEIITQNVTQIATDRAADWSYEQRREAQQVLDFLYLGPNSVVRDHGFLQREGITMVLVVRDARMAPLKLVSVEKAAQAFNLTVHYLDVQGNHQLISRFPEIIRAINDHLLAVYHSQAQGVNQDGKLVVEPSTFRRGKVLIACETGNDRSAAIAAAYIMAIFGKDMVTAIQFICIQRFCCCFDEDAKRTLQSWEDILRARSQVALQAEASRSLGHPKRHIDEVNNEDLDMTGEFALDEDRFQGREAFKPFVDM
ncbi:hypothetical protein FZEAL_4366 [Fusarium zealandicum]|uniref:RNA helicase n=1 Tax=Fusarium zealandicum TaxID=1053134 RepID=A0A8H4UMN0_9HYPO|nr:hypothetical protein FZEAL_4366 [Fusarium zealandicum]